MYVDDHLLWTINQARLQERLAEADAWRLAETFQQNKKVSLWRRLRWQAGHLMITLGYRLQAHSRTRKLMHKVS